MADFISEDDLKTFDGWLRYQGVDAQSATPEELAMWRDIFAEGQENALKIPKVGLMKLKPVLGEYRYAVATRDGDDLWLNLWVRRSPKGEYFVMMPRGNRGWDPHTSYHLDGTRHDKSHGKMFGEPKKFQPLTKDFKGAEHIGGYMGHAPKGVGAICDPNAFSAVVEVSPGILGPRQGSIIVDLIEPDHAPLPLPNIVKQEIFNDAFPSLVLRIAS